VAELRTKGFEIGKRLLHFDKHKLEYNWADQFDYEEQADGFLTDPLKPTQRECRRLRDGALVRYDSLTGEFGILHASGYIGTYLYRRHRGLEYFEKECQ
jgi:hypothetical protein